MNSAWISGSAIAFGLVLTACGGDSSGPSGVPAPVVTTVALAPNNPTVFMGDTLQVTATVKDQSGAAMSGKKPIWSSGAPAVATVDSTGLVIALTSGSATISAAVESKTGSIIITSTGPATGGGASGSANIGAAGGSVHATLPGGGTLDLIVPAGALSKAATITLDPLAPVPGALASFRISPSELRLDVPATLTIHVSPGAKVRSTTTLVLDQNGQQIPFPATVNATTGTVTVSLSLLPAGGSGSSSALQGGKYFGSTSGASSGTLSLLNLNLNIRFTDAAVALSQLKSQGTIPSADNMQTAMEAVTALDMAAALADARFAPLRSEWITAVCDFGNFAFNALSNFGVVSDYRLLEQVVGAVINWSRIANQQDAYLVSLTPSSLGCRNLPNAQLRIQSKLATLEPLITADLNAFALEPLPRDSLFFVDRIKPLLSLGVALGAAGFSAELQQVIDIVAFQIDRVRFAGYARCISNPENQEIQGRLARSLLTGALPGLSASELEADIELCGMFVLWELRDSTGTDVGHGNVGGGNQRGQIFASGTASLLGNGQLIISRGRLQALLCPSPASANAEQLEFLAGPNAVSLTRIALLSPSNQNQYIPVSDLVILTPAIRAAAGISVNGAGTAVIIIQRIGGTCNGLFGNLGHSTIGRITLNFTVPPPLSITTTTLPAGSVGVAYSTTLQATGGPAGPIVWSLAQGNLPGGLALSAAGQITGTPNAQGVFQFTVQAQRGADIITRQLSITVEVAFSINGLFTDYFENQFESYQTRNYTATVPLSLTQFLPVVWSATGLAPGLTLVSTGPTTARLSGPCVSTQGVFVVTVRATLGAVTVSGQPFTITVGPQSQPIPC